MSLMTSRSSRLTLRDIDGPLRAALEKEARRRGVSLNRAAIALLREATGQTGESDLAEEAHDLDDLAGTWTAEEADELDAAVREQRQIDSELWR